MVTNEDESDIYAIEMNDAKTNTQVYKIGTNGAEIWKDAPKVQGVVSNFQILPQGLIVVSDKDTSGKSIFRIENNYLLNRYIDEGNGVAVIAIHNRSVDMLLKWINTKCETTTLYKKVKIKTLDRFVRKQREGKNNNVYETTMTGVRKIFQAYKANKTICIAADQVPQEGMGEYIKLFNIDAYTTTLASSLVHKTQKPAVFICLNSFENNKLGVTIKPCRKDIYSESKHQLSLNKSIESLININPKDYSWEYKRYKKLLSGENPYKNI